MRRVRCRSGITGWQCRLRANYADFGEFKQYAEQFGLHTRLGYRTPARAWRSNPVVQGSVVPGDFRRVRCQKRR